MVGETLEGDLYNLGPGGKGTNQATAAARQGKRVAVIGKVGTDLYGDMAIDLYKKEGIDYQGVYQTDQEKTSIAVIYFFPSGDNCIGLYPGANHLLTSEEVKHALQRLAPVKVLSAQLELPDDAIEMGFKMAKEYGAQIILDPAPARKIDSSILKMVSVLTPNESEARILCGLKPDDDSLTVEELGNKLLEMGPEAVIITLGAQGSLILEHNKKPTKIEPYLVNTVDTIGAGDCFAGSMAVALAEGKSLVDGAAWANVAAALSTRDIGGIKPLPLRKEIVEHMSKWKIQKGM